MIGAKQLPQDQCDKCSDAVLLEFIPTMGCTLLCGIICGWATGRFLWPMAIKKMGKPNADGFYTWKPVTIGILLACGTCMTSIGLKMSNSDNKLLVI